MISAAVPPPAGDTTADDEAAALVAAVRAGDTGAYATLYRRYVRLIDSVVREHVTDPAGAADAVQEVFTRALAGLDRLRDPSRFRPWLCSIARHVAVDTARKRPGELPIDGWDDAAALDPEPAEFAEAMELAEHMRDAVVSLLPRDAVALSLVSLGFGPAEVATALGTTRGAAKVAVHRARKRLRAALLQRALVRHSGCPALAAAVEQGDFEDLPQHVSTCTVCRRDALGV